MLEVRAAFIALPIKSCVIRYIVWVEKEIVWMMVMMMRRKRRKAKENAKERTENRRAEG